MQPPPAGLGDDWETPRRRAADDTSGDYPRWFWALVVLGGALVLVLPLVWLLNGSRAAARVDRERNEACLYNLGRIARAAQVYAEDNGALPPSRAWTDRLTPILKREKGGASLLRCPALDAPFGYAMQAALGTRAMSDINQPARALLFFDSTAGRPNTADSLDSFPQYGRHLRKANAVFADGHAESLAPGAAKTFAVPSLHGG